MTDMPDDTADLYGTLKAPSHPSDKATIFAALRNVAIFSDLAEPDLDWFVERTHEFRFEPAEVMMQEGAPAKLMFVLLEGEIRGRKEGGGDAPVITIEAPTVTGLLPFSRLKDYKLTIRATLPTWGLAYSHTRFGDLRSDSSVC
jgi:CRP-like cAMP-binding protein